jgi:uncharacterized protein (TIGR02391 family)
LREVRELARLWPQLLDRTHLEALKGISEASNRQDFRRIVVDLLPQIEDQVDDYFSVQLNGDYRSALVSLLHPVILESAYVQFRNGHFREAIFNAVVAVFDFLRERSGLELDGPGLAQEAFALDRPKLIISTLDTDSGKNEQKGFIELLKGAYQGIRNPKAHTLNFDPNELIAGQNLVFASLLARRIDEAKAVPAIDAANAAAVT